MVVVPWTFAGEQNTHMLNCWILPGCVHDLVLRKHFLSVTKALTKFVRSRLVTLRRRFRLMLLGEVKQHLWGSLADHPTAALADTGSDIMLISSAYARKIGLTINRDSESCVEVEFADGTTSWTSGIVRDVPWTVGGKTVRCDFHVLDDLCVDVILSNTYVFDLDVFSEFRHHLIDADSEEELSHFCNIRLIGRYGDTLNSLEEDCLDDMTSPDAFSPEMIQRELARRDHIRDEILNLEESQREVANQAEAERQRQWQSWRQSHQARWGATGSRTPQFLNGHSIPHGVDAQRDRIQTSGGNAAREGTEGNLQSSTVRKTWWKKKIKLSIHLRSLRSSN